MKTPKTLLILAAAAAASSVYADRISVLSAPPPVQSAIRLRAGSHRIQSLERSIQNGQITYDASWRDNSGARQQVVVSEAGTILRDVIAPSLGLSGDNLTLANRTGIAVQDLPQSVQNAIHNQLPDAPIDGVQRGIWNGQNIYEVTYHDNGRLRTVQITETGQPVVSQVPAATQIASADIAAPQVNTTVTGLGATTPTTVTPPAATTPIPPAVTSPVPPAVTSPVPPAVTSPTLPATTSPVPPPVTSPVPPSVTTATPPTVTSPVPPVATPVGVPNTPAAATQLRFAGLAEANVPIVAGSRMSVNEAPREVQHTIQQLANGARVAEFQRGWWNGQVVYEAAFRRNGQDIQVQVLDNGMILTTPPTAAGGPATGVTGTVQP